MERWTHGVDLVEGLPLLVGNPQELGGLDGPLHLTGPHLQLTDLLLLDEPPQALAELGRGETGRCIHTGGQEHHSAATKPSGQGSAGTSPVLPYESCYFEVKTTRQIDVVRLVSLTSVFLQVFIFFILTF